MGTKAIQTNQREKKMESKIKTFTSLADFFVDVNSRRTPYPSMSRGMFFFLELDLHYPNIADRIRNTEYDPSSTDSVLTNFVIRVLELDFKDRYESKNT